MKTKTQLERSALAWWRSKRPVGWTAKQHREAPIVNTATEAEKQLARAAAKSRGTKNEH